MQTIDGSHRKCRFFLRMAGLIVIAAAVIAGAAVGAAGESTKALVSPRIDEREQNRNLQESTGAVRIALELDDVIVGFFTEVTGLGSESEVVELRSGTESADVITKIPGRIAWKDITLKRGLTSDLSIWEWRKMVEDGNFPSAQTNGGILILDSNHNEIARWEFVRGWPTKVIGYLYSTCEQCGTGKPVEELVITHEGIRRVR